MRNLLWKDFWQNSRVLLAVGIIAAIPYMVVLGTTAGRTLADWSQATTATFEIGMWAEAMREASGVSLGLCILMAAFIGGNAIAGERADRSAEFASGLPIPRGKAVASKATVAAVACLAMWAINAATWLIGWQVDVHAGTNVYHHRGDEAAVLPFYLLAIVALLGLSWLCSSLLRNPAIAAAAAIGTALGCVLAFGVLGASLELEKSFLLVWGPVFVVSMSILFFAAGVEISRRRVEP